MVADMPEACNCVVKQSRPERAKKLTDRALISVEIAESVSAQIKNMPRTWKSKQNKVAGPPEKLTEQPLLSIQPFAGRDSPTPLPGRSTDESAENRDSAQQFACGNISTRERSNTLQFAGVRASQDQYVTQLCAGDRARQEHSKDETLDCILEQLQSVQNILTNHQDAITKLQNTQPISEENTNRDTEFTDPQCAASNKIDSGETESPILGTMLWPGCGCCRNHVP